MNEYPPYTEAGWQRDKELLDQGHRFFCPDCLSDTDYGPRWTEPPAATRHYRACKDCGFWQEADGTPPYRCWQPEHECAKSEGGYYREYKTPDEDPFECPNCHEMVSRQESEVPWPCAGSG